MTGLDNEIQKYRSKICKGLIVAVAIIAIPGLAISLYRINYIGWQPVMAFHIIVSIILWLVALFKNRLPYKYLANFIIFIFIMLGVGGLLQFGLMSGASFLLMASSPLATLLYGKRVGIIIFIISFSAAFFVAFLTASGYLTYEFNITSYAKAPSSWAIYSIGMGIASITLILSFNSLNKELIDSLKLILEKVTIEKEKALAEVKMLEEVIPICSYCHSIRDDEGAWDRLEAYLSKKSGALFSHGICPKCIPKVRAEAGLDNEEQNI